MPFVLTNQRKSIPQLWPLAILLTSNLLAAFYAPIQDCDEVFNFWEPTHYLLHGYGLQTWELSPEFSIRSWLYVSLHALPIKLLSGIPAIGSSKVNQFYLLRSLLGLVAAFAGWSVFEKLWRFARPRLAIYHLIIMVTSAGSFIASASFLPSTFAMYCVSMAMSNRVGLRTSNSFITAIIWLALGTIAGWPFVGVLCIPWALHEVYRWWTEHRNIWLSTLWDALGRSLIILAIEVIADSAFTKRFHSVPLNITLYNVFSGPDRGPEIYGTEPQTFYDLNLLLNYNIAYIVALCALPLHLCLSRAAYSAYQDFAVHLTPFYLWLASFRFQPHKEERFMYPAYPLLAFNAAYSLCVIGDVTERLVSQARTLTSQSGPRQTSKASERPGETTSDNNLNNPRSTWLPLMLARPISILSPSAPAYLIATLLGLSSVAGIWRSVGLTTAYTAPLQIYTSLPSPPMDMDVNVCVGKEWYRFPSSFFLPSPIPNTDGYLGDDSEEAPETTISPILTESSDESMIDGSGETIEDEQEGSSAGRRVRNDAREAKRVLKKGHRHGKMRLKFIRSAFHGLLPGEFDESTDTWFPGAWKIPPGMNDRNEEDTGKYTDIAHCDYLIDFSSDDSVGSKEEPNYVTLAKQGSKEWKIRTCDKFLDAGKTGLLARVGWMPDRWRVWGEYCLLERAR